MKAQATRFPQLRLLGKGRKRTLTGQVKTKLPFSISGKVRAEWQNKRGGKWKKIHGGVYNAGKPFKFKQTLRVQGPVARARQVRRQAPVQVLHVEVDQVQGPLS